MTCSRCKKKIAVVFMTRPDTGRPSSEGYCVQCAKDLGIQPVCDMLASMGIGDAEIEQMEQEIQNLLSGIPDDASGGHAMALPQILKNLMQNPQLQDMGMSAMPPLSQPQPPQGEPDRPRVEESPQRRPRDKRPKPKLLEQFCICLTQRAREGKIDRIIGRERETARVIQILNRRQKNNPCLIGEPGVGKTAVAEGLALRIANGQVPARLMDKEIFLLDLTALVAGTQFRGQFESRIKNLIAEIKQQGNVILVIDEVHTLVSAGEAEGSMSAANILKPALSRGEIQVVGATTFNEYRKSIEKDAALERRFQPVVIEEPSVKDTVEILKGIRSYYEDFHQVAIDEETVMHAVQLSERYITDRFLPDKAIDLIDEAASLCNIHDEEGNRAILLRRQLEDLNDARAELVQDGSDQYYEELASLRAEEIRIETELERIDRRDLKINVTAQQLAQVIELWTGIPASKIAESEFQKLSGLDAELRARVVGQDEAIDALVRALRRNRAGISPKRKPASFIFIGPTGVGKTELVKTLAGALFDSPETMIRLDMSEFMEKHSVSRLIGSPPGYVGYDEAGQLTEKVRRKPYCVILFDEIEKAHPDVLNVLLQILDDGRVTDAHGRTVNFENTVIVMTSNAGSEKRELRMGFGGTGELRSKEKALKALEAFLRPEFINRVDEIVAFRPLSREDFSRIAGIMLEDLRVSMQLSGRVLTVDDAVIPLLVETSFSEQYGARNLRRAVEKEVEDRIATLIVGGYDREVRHIHLSVAEGQIAASCKDGDAPS